MEPFLLIFGTIALLIFVLVRNKSYFAAEDQKWESAAERLGLTYVDRAISGEYDGVDVEVRQEGRLDRKGFYIAGKATLDATTVPRDLKIYRETLAEKMGKLLGSEDVELGIPALDRQLIIKTANADAVREWASDAAVTRGLEELAALSASLKIEPHEIAVQLFVAKIAEDQLVELIETLARSARALSGMEHRDETW